MGMTFCAKETVPPVVGGGDTGGISGFVPASRHPDRSRIICAARALTKTTFLTIDVLIELFHL
jgi:hypothetical protein